MATEQEVGWSGPPGDAVFAELDPDAPEAALVLRHGVIDRVEDPTIGAERAQASERLRPFSKQSGLSRQVDVDDRGFGVDLDRDLDVDSLRGGAGERVVACSNASGVPAGIDANRRAHPLLAVVEPIAYIGRRAAPSRFRAPSDRISRSPTRAAPSVAR